MPCGGRTPEAGARACSANYSNDVFGDRTNESRAGSAEPIHGYGIPGSDISHKQLEARELREIRRAIADREQQQSVIIRR